jgi:hypothetical protein
MSKPGFFNDNLNRSYPFTTGSVGIDVPDTGPIADLSQLPDDFVADCGFTIAASETFDPSLHDVFLHQIRRPTPTTLEFEFRCSDPTLAAMPLIFQRSAGDTLHTYFVDGPTLYTSEPPSSDPIFPAYSPCGPPLWYAYAVFGDIEAVFARLSVGDVIARTSPEQAIVHPPLLTNTTAAAVTSLNVANRDRTRATAPADCPQPTWSFLTGETYVNAQCVTGVVKLFAGYNLSLAQLASSIVLTPVLNAGRGTPCEEIPLFAGETGPVGQSNARLAGDYLCNEVFRSINGVGGPDVRLIAGNGVTVVGDPLTNTLTVDVNLQSLSACGGNTVDITEYV